jgi:tRNA 2-thiocytidine biosynthesis protein TtcA
LELEKALLRKVGEAVTKFQMIRDGDRVAVGVSGGKDSVTLLEALLHLQRRAPISFSVCAFTIEQGKFLAPIEPYGKWLLERGVDWHYFPDAPSMRLLEDEPDHGCDLCSRFRRRAVYQHGKTLGANVIALGHTADDFCETLLRNAMFTGALSSLPPVTYSKNRDFRLIRPLVFTPETLTTAYAASLGCPVIPCGCSQKTGAVRRSLRDFLGELEQEHPNLKDSLLAAMGNVKLDRLLDTRYLDVDAVEEAEVTVSGGPFPILTNAS